MAAPAATFAYRERFGDAFARTYFRRFGELTASSIGHGVRPAIASDTDDPVAVALDSGVNLFEAAPGRDGGRGERTLGAALRAADVDRERVVLTSSAGFVPFVDIDESEDPAAYVAREYVRPGLVEPDELVGGQHCIAPAFVDAQLDRSLARLGVETLDCLYVRDPEVQFDERDAETVYDDLTATFETLERRVAAGDLRRYGVAAREGLRVPPDRGRHLSLPELVSRADAAADAAGRAEAAFGAVQTPFNVWTAEAFATATQETGAGRTNALSYAREAGLDAVAAEPLAGGALAATAAIPPSVDRRLAGDTPAQRALNFARSAPGVVAAVPGVRTPDHVRENVAAGTFEPLGAAAFDATFE
jgi:aryl-alcohol dehydrogenase-like predicted oxidoreductase